MCSSIAEHMLWEPAESEFRDAVEHDLAAFRLISHQKPLSPKPDFKMAAGSLCLWHAVYCAWAEHESLECPWTGLVDASSLPSDPPCDLAVLRSTLC